MTIRSSGDFATASLARAVMYHGEKIETLHDALPFDDTRSGMKEDGGEDA